MNERSEQNAVADVGSEPLFCTAPDYRDGREWDCQCARCGSSVDFEMCEYCGGEGWTEPGDLYSENPLWYDEDEVAPCHVCNGACSFPHCCSSLGWCEANPLPGREDVNPGTVEWFPIPGTGVQNSLIHRNGPDNTRQAKGEA
jgi:hypothetical protein